MASNRMNDKWLRPVLALCTLAGMLALGGCGGGSGAPNNPFAPGPIAVGPLFVLPPTAVVYSHTPATLQVSGGAPPYQAFSSNSAVLPVAQNVAAGVIVLVPGEVVVDTVVIITVQDAIGQTATSSVTVSPAPLFNTLTVVPSRTVCGTNAVCSGDTATATVQVTGTAGAGIPNRQVRFDVVLGAFAIQSSNPGQPLVSSLTVVSDANGAARVVLQAGVNVPTQPAEIRATDLTTGNSVTASFIIVQQTDGSAILSVVPATATITGVDTAHCSTGFRIDYFIYGGTSPYHISSTFPDAVTLVNSTVTFSGGSFQAITNGSCVDPLVFTIVDATGRQVTAELINKPGTTVIPPPPPPPPVVTPTALTVTPNGTLTPPTCAGTVFPFVITGGTPSYNVSLTSSAGPLPGSVTGPNTSGGFTVQSLPAGSTNLIKVADQSSPQQSQVVTIICPQIQIAPALYSVAGAGSCTGQTFPFTITGAHPTFTVTVTSPGIATPSSGIASGGTVNITNLADGSGVKTVTVTDSLGNPKNATITCGT